MSWYSRASATGLGFFVFLFFLEREKNSLYSGNWSVYYFWRLPTRKKKWRVGLRFKLVFLYRNVINQILSQDSVHRNKSCLWNWTWVKCECVGGTWSCPAAPTRILFRYSSKASGFIAPIRNYLKTSSINSLDGSTHVLGHWIFECSNKMTFLLLKERSRKYRPTLLTSPAIITFRLCTARNWQRKKNWRDYGEIT